MERMTNFLVIVDCQFQFEIVKQFLEKLYPENDFSTWKYDYRDRFVVGFMDKPTYDFLLSNRNEDKMSFREFLNKRCL